MDSEEVSSSTTDGRGMEIDYRPHPALRASETQRLRAPVRSHRDGAEEVTADWPEGHVTGAFVSAAASLRHAVEPYRWWQMWSIVLIWGLPVGIPAGFGIWAAFKVWALVHG